MNHTKFVKSSNQHLNSLLSFYQNIQFPFGNADFQNSVFEVLKWLLLFNFTLWLYCEERTMSRFYSLLN